MTKLFGFSIEDGEKNPKGIVSTIPRKEEDGVGDYIQGGLSCQDVDIEGIYKNEHELIKRYKEMKLHRTLESASEEEIKKYKVEKT